jgi:hypothetical protein
LTGAMRAHPLGGLGWSFFKETCARNMCWATCVNMSCCTQHVHVFKATCARKMCCCTQHVHARNMFTCARVTCLNMLHAAFAARFLPLPLSCLGKFMPPLNTGVHQKLGGRDVAELGCGLGRLGNPTDTAAHAARGGYATRAARAAHAGPRAAAHSRASPAVCTCCLPRKAALRSEAEMASIMTARVFCGRVSQVFLATFEPEIDVLEWPGTNF